jgi:hypothetical protein
MSSGETVFEDLTDNDFRAIINIIPTALTLPDIKDALAKVRNFFLLNELDAITAILIAQESANHYKAIDRIISYRVEDLLNERSKVDLKT